MADRLIALTYIQTDMGFTRYRPGDTLPDDHPDAATWLENGSAVRRGESDAPPTWAKAQLAAAPPASPASQQAGRPPGTIWWAGCP